MGYDLETFCAQCRDVLAREDAPAAREHVRRLLEKLLADDAFLAEHLGPEAPIGTRQIYRDDEAGFCVITYNTAAPRVSPPHDHGESWAVYGQVRAHTDMTVFRRVAGVGPGPAEIERVRSYRLEPGHAGLYDVGDIHAIDYPAGAQFVRVTGTDLEEIPRLKFDVERGEAVAIESATVR